MILSILKLFLLIALFNPIIFSQDKPITGTENLNTLSRYRLLSGYSFIAPQDEPSFNNLFVNINYRSSIFNKTTKPWKIGMAFEIGTNILISEKVLYSIGILPYLKTGPEMKLTGNLFLGTSLGLAISIDGYPAVLHFAGLNSFYFIPLNKNLFLEFEAGFHTTFFAKSVLVYIAAGIAF